MTESADTGLLERVNRAFSQVRAEYESDDDLYRRFSPPLYFDRLMGIDPHFLVGGRGTGKTTTLRSMSFTGQMHISDSDNPDLWRVVGAYWKVEPSVVSVFKGKGIAEDVWSSVFSHYLNLKLCTLVLEYATWLDGTGAQIKIDAHRIQVFAKSLNMERCDSVGEILNELDLALADVEAKINGRISSLTTSSLSLLGRPVDYLFAALDGLRVTRGRPFMFCLDEYENLAPYQQKLLNTLVKQVGGAPYTFKIGVRNKVAIDQSTLIDNQPLQDPADFTTVDIVDHLKDESFDSFAETVLRQRFATVGIEPPSTGHLFPTLPIDEEARLLGADGVRDDLVHEIEESGASVEEIDFARSLPVLDACMVARWADSHSDSRLSVLRYARANPERWRIRMGNYGYAMLFTVREKRVGERKYYTGWRTYCQIADGNIRYLIRLVHEALRMHVTDGRTPTDPVSSVHQTRAAARVGETTIRDLQGWSRQGAALTRLVLGLGSIFASLARETGLATPEVSQFRVRYEQGSKNVAEQVEQLLAEAVGQGILIGFDGDKNARMSGATRQMDYQLHPVLAPYFVYSARSKRRMTIDASDLMSLTVRERAASTVRRILRARGAATGQLPEQLELFGTE